MLQVIQDHPKAVAIAIVFGNTIHAEFPAPEPVFHSQCISIYEHIKRLTPAPALIHFTAR